MIRKHKTRKWKRVKNLTPYQFHNGRRWLDVYLNKGFLDTLVWGGPTSYELEKAIFLFERGEHKIEGDYWILEV